MSAPLLFAIPEDSHIRGFIFASLTVSLTTAFVLEYRFWNPFGTYPDSASVALTNLPPRRRVTGIAQTASVAFIITLLTLTLLFRLFALGESLTIQGATHPRMLL